MVFDDLLSSSSRTLDMNPFANLFAQPPSGSTRSMGNVRPTGKTRQYICRCNGLHSPCGSTLGSTYDVYNTEGGRSVEEQHPQHGEGSVPGRRIIQGACPLPRKQSPFLPTTNPIESPPSRHFPLSPGFRESVSNEGEDTRDDRA